MPYARTRWGPRGFCRVRNVHVFWGRQIAWFWYPYSALSQESSKSSFVVRFTKSAKFMQKSLCFNFSYSLLLDLFFLCNRSNLRGVMLTTAHLFSYQSKVVCVDDIIGSLATAFFSLPSSPRVKTGDMLTLEQNVPRLSLSLDIH